MEEAAMASLDHPNKPVSTSQLKNCHTIHTALLSSDTTSILQQRTSDGEHTLKLPFVRSRSRSINIPTTSSSSLSSSSTVIAEKKRRSLPRAVRLQSSPVPLPNGYQRGRQRAYGTSTSNIGYMQGHTTKLKDGSLWNTQKESSLVLQLFTAKELREKFVRAFRLVRCVVRISLWLKDYSRDQPQTIEQLNYYYCTANDFQTETLVFSKSTFAASNLVYLPLWARQMLSLSPGRRSDKDVHHLATMLKSMTFFKSGFPFEKILDFSRHCWYERYEKQRVILRADHPPLNCYLLFSGSVFVNIREWDETKGLSYFRTHSVLQRGSIFGEIAVIHGINRTASIISRENVECLVIEGDDCKRIVPEEIMRQFDTRLEHMRRSELFADWPEQSLLKLCTVSKQTEYSYGSVITKNAADSEFIYMVTKGRVELMYSLCASPALSTTAVADCPSHLDRSNSHSQALTQSSLKSNGKERMICVDSLEPYSVCDLGSLVGNTDTRNLILVSRGSEVIWIPKFRLRLIPSLRCWRQILEKARSTPRYPTESFLTGLFTKHTKWSAYKSVILQDSLDRRQGSMLAMKPKSLKSLDRWETSMSIGDEKSGMSTKKDQERQKVKLINGEVLSYEKCVSCKGALCDLELHKHEGPCLRSWHRSNMSQRAPKYLNRRSLSFPG